MRFKKEVFQRNRDWASSIHDKDPDFFNRLAAQQNPDILWIGCADSRVPANEIMGMLPGEVFVHRNIANLVLHADINCQSVIQYAVEVLEVSHIVVCGHYGCGGVKAAMDLQNGGLIQHWLRNITDTYARHYEALSAIPDKEKRAERLCELNVIAQVKNLSSSNVVQNAWAADKPLKLHGWIYSIHDGLLRDLNIDISNLRGVSPLFRAQGKGDQENK